jgi:hypothetical protein
VIAAARLGCANVGFVLCTQLLYAEPEAVRLDERDAPRRELARQKKEADG